MEIYRGHACDQPRTHPERFFPTSRKATRARIGVPRVRKTGVSLGFDCSGGKFSHRVENIADKTRCCQLPRTPGFCRFSKSSASAHFPSLFLSISPNERHFSREIQAGAMPVKIREVRGKIHGRLRGRYRRKFLTLSRPQSTLTSRARARAENAPARSLKIDPVDTFRRRARRGWSSRRDSARYSSRTHVRHATRRRAGALVKNRKLARLINSGSLAAVAVQDPSVSSRDRSLSIRIPLSGVHRLSVSSSFPLSLFPFSVST